ncbi:DUF6134 family protein [Denitrobaculum tricleocarpae]|uniref:DUF3108 domain-containing protein n=1 Tax=Denitrobaculum tricleocarpae TaxID=2591009 RepID=A0A545TF39_9PROT|nr:DUF6134 family protein [Denitrobaculum tricleocarpae]TQV75852.1 hypothetical protein FKG95_23360 [Denitrobaculum tricleocarpae]
MTARTSSRTSFAGQASKALTVTLFAALFLGLLAKQASAGDLDQVSAIHKKSDFGFSVLREGDAIGNHSIDFTRRGEDLVVDVSIDLEVKFAFITVYRYTHRNQEIWRDGQLYSIKTKTDDDGTEHWVKGRASAEGFVVESDSGNAVLPSDVIPSSYWHPDTPKAETLLNTQTGELAQINVAAAASKSYVPMPWGQEAARSFEISGDVDLNLWYDDKGCLLKMNFAAPGDGSQIDYVPARHPVSASGPSLAGYPLIGDCVRLEMTSIGPAQH